MRISEAKNVLLEICTDTMNRLKTGESFSSIVVPYLEGDPGLGKTSVVSQVAEEMGGSLTTIRLADYTPTEFGGWNLPNADRTQMVRVPPLWFPKLSEKPVFIFLDELPQGMTAVQNVAGQIINERMCGPYMLPENAIIVAAGNPTKARAGTNHTPTHVKDRLTFLTVEAYVEDTVGYFMSKGINPAICAYLRFKPESLSKFDKDASACPSPRSWERVNSIVSAVSENSMMQAAVGGTVGEAVAADFMAYRKLITAVPDMDALIASPDTAPIPDDPGILFAVAASLAQRTNRKNVENVAKYLKRLPRKEIAAFVIADIRQRDKALAANRHLMEFLVSVDKELNLLG